MYRATADIVLPTTITGSLPRPSWYTETLGTRSFLDAMVNARFREQYTDALAAYIRDQATAGLDIFTDGDCRFENDVGGQSWARYPLQHMSGLDQVNPAMIPLGRGGVSYPRGHILHDYMESRVMPTIVGPIGPGTLQYAAMWKLAQGMTRKPVKFGTITAELVAFSAHDRHYRDIRDRILAFSEALNKELHALADAGCPVIQMEEPQIHMLAAKGLTGGPLNLDFMVQVFNATVKGLRAKTEVWCHSCWGNPSQQRIFETTPSYAPSLEAMNKVDADVITFECCSSGPGDLKAIGERIADKKVAIGVIDHHTLQVEKPTEIAALIRHAIKHVQADRLVISSDCGMGREGMSRRHAFYKMVSLVQGTNIVRRELDLPEADCLAADPRYTLTVSE
jgi:5-methyltetrahydropteroyltriglutamate--homocysteine methyltransferase